MSLFLRSDRPNFRETLKTAWFQALSSVSTNTFECGKGAARWLPLGERLAEIFTVSFDSVLPACYHLLDGSTFHANTDACRYLAFYQSVGCWWSMVINRKLNAHLIGLWKDPGGCQWGLSIPVYRIWKGHVAMPSTEPDMKALHTVIFTLGICVFGFIVLKFVSFSQNIIHIIYIYIYIYILALGNDIFFLLRLIAWFSAINHD